MTARLEAAVAELVNALLDEVRGEAEAAQALPDRLLSMEEAARRLGIGRTLVYNLVGRDLLPSVKIGRRRLIPAASVSDYIAERQARA